MDFYARVGLAYWEYDGRNIDEDGNDPYFGLGAAFNIGSSLDIYGEWVRFDQEAKIDSLGLGIRWTILIPGGQREARLYRPGALCINV